MMRYPILIEEGSETADFGVAVPDLPGCFSAGDTLEEAMEGATEAAAAWIDIALNAGAAIPAPSRLADVRALPEYEGWSVGVIDLDMPMTEPEYRAALAEIDSLMGASSPSDVERLRALAERVEAYEKEMGPFWNYRLVRHKDGCLAIHEVYYDGDGRSNAATQDPVGVVGDDEAEVRRVLEQMARALTMPVLDFELIGRKEP